MTKNYDNVKGAMNGLIEELSKAEKITREKLPEFISVGVDYVHETHDVDYVNRLIGVLSPANKRFAIHFMQVMLPHVAEKLADGTHSRFGKLMPKQVDQKKAIGAWKKFLADGGDFWAWTEANIVTKVPDYVANMERALKTAIKGNEKKGVEPADPGVICDIFLQNVGLDKFMKHMAEQRDKFAVMSAPLGDEPQKEPDQTPANKQAA